MRWRSTSTWLILAFLFASCGAKADEFDDALASFEPRILSTEELEGGWLSLFDGESLFGWRNEGDADFEVRDNAIVATTGSRPCLLRTLTQFDRYQITLSFLSDIDTNSGVFLHTPPRPTDPGTDCYEINIADASITPFPTGSIVERALHEHDVTRVAWRHLDIVVDGPDITVKLDGKVILKYEDEKPLGRGFIGLQYNSGRIAFGNVFIRPLTLQPIFDGETLDGWNRYPEMEGEFAVDDQGHLRVTGGRGQLETVDNYGDFILQLQCKTHARELNSGIFFRCIPGEVMNGYESQIHNGFLDGDRTQVMDCGTGGIFRRQNARYVNANDLEWFSKTIIAQGPHISVWVNGIQVCDWTDRRERDLNPRRGLRTEPGTLMIQAHDPTTDISFDALRIREMDERNR